MNSVALVGRIYSIRKIPDRGKYEASRAMLCVHRPYKVNGVHWYDYIDILGLGEMSKRLQITKEKTVVGIMGALERDTDTREYYVNVKSIMWYGNITSEKLAQDLKDIPDNVDLGFGAVLENEIPDF